MIESYSFWFCGKSDNLKVLLQEKEHGYSLPKNLERDFLWSGEEFSFKDHIWVKLLDLEELPLHQGAHLCVALGKLWPNMPTSKVSQGGILPRKMIKNNLDMERGEVTFFGGSFNPWHNGHMACLKLCPEKNIIVIPDYNPWKVSLRKDTEICRWKLFRELMDILEDYSFAIFPGFWGLSKPNPTVSWVPMVEVEKKNFLMGDDSIKSFLNWSNVEKLGTALSHIFVAPRKTPEQELIQIIDDVQSEFPHLKLSILGDHPYRDLSSTELRNKKQQ